MKNLTVYRASAGSGKTFTLALEYIKLLVENPQSFRQTLAVTFTNKATEEMKMRILSDLYGISKGLKNSDTLLEKIKESTEFSEKQIRERAWKSLQLLIHNYNYFRVETIDAFFQTVLRNLAKELDLSANLKIELNDAQVEQQAVDELIESLDETSLLLYWILDYIHENIEDDKSWNVISQIKNFGLNIFKDYYKKNQNQLSQILDQKDCFKNYTQKLRSIRSKAKSQLAELADNFFDTLESNGFSVDDFSRKSSGPCGYFIKLKSGDFVDDEKIFNKTAQEAASTPEKWVVKKLARPGEPIYDLVCDTLMQMLNNAENTRIKQAKLYKSADLTLRHLSQLRLLGCIGDKVTELNNEVNRFMLSNTQTLLSSMIEDSDSPFIFEKIGTQLENIMIDEFQDTSTVQWENFKVLLKETMSREGKNLIVGDVKQSIYRWRSGDWRLLNNIDRQFANHTQQLEIKNLETNYRSQKNIIDFNNCFFSVAADKEYIRLGGSDQAEAIQLKNAYHDVRQEVPEKRKDNGLVSIALLSADDYDNKMLVRTLDTVKDLLDHHIQPQKIAIILRKNEHISLLANYLSQNLEGIKIVSDEAFRLDASIAVQIIVQAMHLITHPDDILAKAFLVKAYQNQMLDNHLTDNQLYLSSRPMDDFLPVDYVTKMDSLKNRSLYDLAEYLYAVFETAHQRDKKDTDNQGAYICAFFDQMTKMDSLKNMSLYDLAEYLYAVFETAHQKDKKDTDNQGAYICAFFDQVSSFMADNSTDIDLFLEEWENNIHNKSIQSNEIDGIRLISIHKSKGLEFDNVIIPYCD